VVGNQFPLVFQSVEPDEAQVALPAKVVLGAESKSGRTTAALRNNAHTRKRRGD